MPVGPAPKSAAKTRLTNMLAWEVSAVDKPANARPFHMLKNDAPAATPVATAAAPGAPAAAPAAPPPPAKPEDEEVKKDTFPALKAETKTLLIDAVVSAAEKYAALASAAAEAPVDEAATASPELLKMLEAAGSDVSALAAKLAPQAPATAPAPVAQATEGGAPAAAPAATPAIAELVKAAVEAATAPLAKAFNEKVVELQKSHTETTTKLSNDLKVMGAKVAVEQGRLALGKSEGNGNSRPNDGDAAPAPKPHRWSSDLAAPLRGEQG